MSILKIELSHSQINHDMRNGIKSLLIKTLVNIFSICEFVGRAANSRRFSEKEEAKTIQLIMMEIKNEIATRYGI